MHAGMEQSKRPVHIRSTEKVNYLFMPLFMQKCNVHVRIYIICMYVHEQAQ